MSNERKIEELTRQNELLKKEIENLSFLKDDSMFKCIFELISDNANFGIALINSSRKIQSSNIALQKMLGFTSDELCALNIADISHPKDYKTDQILFNEILEGKRERYTIEKRYFTKDEKVVYGKLTIIKIKYGANEKFQFISIVENLTDQKQVTEKLAKEQALFYTLLENTADTIYFKDLQSRFIKVNKTMAVKHGFTDSNDVVGKTDFDMFGIEHATQAYNDEQEIIRTGIPKIGIEEKETWHDGKITWVSTSKMPLYSRAGKIIGTFGITRDITEKKLLNDKISESEKVYRSIFENSPDGMFIMDEAIIDCNEVICEKLKYAHDELVGKTPADISPEYQPDGALSAEASKIKIEGTLKGVPHWFEWKHIASDGALLDFEISLNPMTIGGKTTVHATMRDITEKKKRQRINDVIYKISEAALSVQDYSLFFKKIHNSISNLMPAKNFYIALYNDQKQELSFPYFVDEFDPPQKTKQMGRGLTEYVIRVGEPTLVDAQKDLELRRSGEVDLIGAPQAIWLGIPLKVGGKVIGVLVVQDYENEKAYGQDEMQLLSFVCEQISQVIEREKKSMEIKKFADELEVLNSTKDKFFSIIAHDLRNPFITILGFSDVLITDYSEMSDDEKIYYITEMKKAAEVSHNLLQNLLQWSRSQTGRIDFHPSSLNLKNIVRENLDLVAAIAERKEIKLESKIPDDTFVFADEDMLNTIIRNLISNAIKFTKRNGTIKISSSRIEDIVEVSVADNGIGMNDETRQKLFRIDMTQSSFGTENEAGTGLGLILCKEFVEKNSGQIRVESTPDVGTTFYFTLIKSSQ